MSPFLSCFVSSFLNSQRECGGVGDGEDLKYTLVNVFLLKGFPRIQKNIWRKLLTLTNCPKHLVLYDCSESYLIYSDMAAMLLLWEH